MSPTKKPVPGRPTGSNSGGRAKAEPPRDAGGGAGGRGAGGGGAGDGGELRRLRGRIDAVDRRIVGLINERAELTRAVGAEKLRMGRAIRDAGREREVLLRVSMANQGPTPQADLLAIYRRLIASARGLESQHRSRLRREETRDPS